MYLALKIEVWLTNNYWNIHVLGSDKRSLIDEQILKHTCTLVWQTKSDWRIILETYITLVFAKRSRFTGQLLKHTCTLLWQNNVSLTDNYWNIHLLGFDETKSVYLILTPMFTILDVYVTDDFIHQCREARKLPKYKLSIYIK